MSELIKELVKREWVYLMSPKEFEIAPCACGNKETQWSEFREHLWCDKCRKDFVPEHWGVLDGPSQHQVCALVGIKFDQQNLLTGEVKFWDFNSGDFKIVSGEEYESIGATVREFPQEDKE